VIADRGNIRALRKKLGDLIGLPSTGKCGRFATIERENEYLGMRFNDGLELACRSGADYVVPCGSDDWVDHRVIRETLPEPRVVVGFQRMSFVREDGRELTYANVRYRGGCGIRIYPRALLAPFQWRPCDEDRKRGCDTAILGNVLRHVPRVRVEHRDVHDLQIVDWKTPGANLNTYEGVGGWRSGQGRDPFVELRGVYPDEALAEMREVYA
jgi:hypothetical protein